MTSIKKNFAYNTFYQILAILIPLITTPYLTRTLGATGIGEYSYAYSIAYYFVMIIQLGLNNYGNREIAKNRDNIEKKSITFWSIYLMQFICSLFAISIYCLYIILYTKNKIMLITMIPYIISGALDINWFFFGMEEFKITVIRNTIIKIITTISIFFFVKNSSDIITYAYIMTLGMLFTQIVMWPFLKGRINCVRVSRQDVIKHIKPNLILFIPVVAISLYKMMDKIMLGVLANKAEVGYYDSSEKIIQIPMALITSLGTVMLPRMSNLFANSNADIAEKMFSKSINLALFLSTSIGFGIMAIGKTFVPWFYGDGFMKCITLFNILLPSCIFLSFANVIRTQYLIPNEKDREFIISVIMGAGINLIINALLIPKFGSIGAAIGTLIAEATVCIVQVVFVYRELPMKKYIFYSFKYVLSGFIMFIIVYNIEFISLPPLINILLQVFTGVITYLVILSLLFQFENLSRRCLFNGEER